jgi:hypothetical protein
MANGFVACTADKPKNTTPDDVWHIRSQKLADEAP